MGIWVATCLITLIEDIDFKYDGDAYDMTLKMIENALLILSFEDLLIN